ncbi:MAG TPA: plasmid pRiA4b ORF-3 family protein [Gemmataceae bacterium]|nr:plasmid pRiA4b ORF-3 family protein [Gemmataceae bacterium]
MAKKGIAATVDKQHVPERGGPAVKLDRASATEPHRLDLSEAQRHTILKYAGLPAQLAERFENADAKAKGVEFNLDELDELLDYVEGSVYRAKGNERQKVLRIADKVSNLLGSKIDARLVPKRPFSKKVDSVFQIKVTLCGIDPLIWRRLQTKDCTLEELHSLIQITMGWEFEHLYSFDIGGVEYTDAEAPSGDEAGDASAVRLSDVLPVENRRPRFIYVYDFGDDWTHQLIVEERFPPHEGAPYPICLAGQRACPPEDCGGPWGYGDMLEVIQDKDHDRYDEIREWLGEEFDPEAFDINKVNRELAKQRR